MSSRGLVRRRDSEELFDGKEDLRENVSCGWGELEQEESSADWSEDP
jgi:hypothetical protein